MKYYLHDSSSFDDEKITQLYIKFGYEGLGLFYTILEKFAKQEKPIITSVLKHQLNVGKKLEKCWKFMEEIELISSNNGESFNKQLLNFSEKYSIKKEKNKERIKQWRENQQNTENVTRYKSVRNTDKVKESKVKESKCNIYPNESEFLEFALLNDSNLDKQAVINKFRAWSGAGWVNGNGKKIKNWKSSLLNTIPYLP